MNVRTHHERVHKKVIVLEGIESGGGVDSVPVVFSQLDSCNYGTQSPKNEIVEDLHCWREIRKKLQSSKLVVSL